MEAKAETYGSSLAMIGARARGTSFGYSLNIKVIM